MDVWNSEANNLYTYSTIDKMDLLKKETYSKKILTIKKSLNIPNIIFLVTLITMFGEACFAFNKLYATSSPSVRFVMFFA